MSADKNPYFVFEIAALETSVSLLSNVDVGAFHTLLLVASWKVFSKKTLAAP